MCCRATAVLRAERSVHGCILLPASFWAVDEELQQCAQGAPCNTLCSTKETGRPSSYALLKKPFMGAEVLDCAGGQSRGRSCGWKPHSPSPVHLKAQSTTLVLPAGPSGAEPQGCAQHSSHRPRLRAGPCCTACLGAQGCAHRLGQLASPLHPILTPGCHSTAGPGLQGRLGEGAGTHSPVLRVPLLAQRHFKPLTFHSSEPQQLITSCEHDFFHPSIHNSRHCTPGAPLSKANTHSPAQPQAELLGSGPQAKHLRAQESHSLQTTLTAVH